jgi:hypothetical protein
MKPMLRPATPADRPNLIALALAEDAAWSGAPEVSAEEAGEFIDQYGPGVVFARDGRVAGYASAGEGGDTILLSDPGGAPRRRWRPSSCGSVNVAITRSTATRPTRGGSRGSKDTALPTGAPASISNAGSTRRLRPRCGRTGSPWRPTGAAGTTLPSMR